MLNRIKDALEVGKQNTILLKGRARGTIDATYAKQALQDLEALQRDYVFVRREDVPMERLERNFSYIEEMGGSIERASGVYVECAKLLHKKMQEQEQG